MRDRETGQPVALCIMGPTASGKTALALSLCEHFDCEIISVDSAQVYRGMDIGTAKPPRDVLTRFPHRLIDIRDPSEAYSAAEFRRDAGLAIDEILAAGRVPLLVGGTMLYFRALRAGLSALPSAVPGVRAEILALAERIGWAGVHRRLRAVDPEAAARIHPNDPQRLQRALEVYMVAGRSMSRLHAADAGAPRLPCRLLQIAVVPRERRVLHERIAARFDAMLAEGLLEEVRALYARGDLDPSLPSIRSVGYQQLWDFLGSRLSYQEARERAIIATRQLAKRQHTWLRSWPALEWLETGDDGAAGARRVVAAALKLVRGATIS